MGPGRERGRHRGIRRGGLSWLPRHWRSAPRCGAGSVCVAWVGLLGSHRTRPGTGAEPEPASRRAKSVGTGRARGGAARPGPAGLGPRLARCRGFGVPVRNEARAGAACPCAGSIMLMAGLRARAGSRKGGPGTPGLEDPAGICGAASSGLSHASWTAAAARGLLSGPGLASVTVPVGAWCDGWWPSRAVGFCSSGERARELCWG